MTNVSIAEASRILGISQDTVRRRLRTGELSGERVQSPGGFKWLVDVPEPATTDADNHGETEALRKLISVLQTQLDARTREIGELHQLLAARALGPGQRPWWRFWGQ